MAIERLNQEKSVLIKKLIDFQRLKMSAEAIKVWEELKLNTERRTDEQRKTPVNTE